jgi:PAS domain S-box-containing protein
VTVDILTRLRTRLEAARTDATDATAAQELALCLSELEVLWEELENQADLFARDRVRYTAFFQHAPFACAITNGSGNVREANLAACELLGVPDRYLAGKPLQIFCDDADRAHFRTELAHAAVDRKYGQRTWVGRMNLAERRVANVEITASNLPYVMGVEASLLLFLRRLD